MKKALFALVFMSATCLICRPRSITEITKDTRMVQITITLFPEQDNYDAAEWRKIVDDASGIMKKAEDQDVIGPEFMNMVARSIQGLYRHSVDEDGINGRLDISLGDGNCPEGRCNNPCSCKEDYRGLCPCSLDAKRSCKTQECCNN